MAENRCSCTGGSLSNMNVGKESVCIDTYRVLDSCRDKDCFENVPVYLTDFGQEIIDRTSNVRTKCAQILWSCITVDPVQFNRGFYQVTIRFYVKLVFEACVCLGRAQEFEGIAVAEKESHSLRQRRVRKYLQKHCIRRILPVQRQHFHKLFYKYADCRG